MSAPVPSPEVHEASTDVDTQALRSASEHFNSDVAHARIDVELDLSDGERPYRHLIFSNPQRHIGDVHVTTIPGALMVAGDLGAWTFERHGTTDMLTFFHRDEINPSYWAQKLDNGHLLARETYTPAKFVEIVALEKSNTMEWVDDLDVDDDQLYYVHVAYAGLSESAEDHYGSDNAYAALSDFVVTFRDRDGVRHKVEHHDVGEHTFGAWSYSYLYICHLLRHVAETYFADRAAEVS